MNEATENDELPRDFPTEPVDVAIVGGGAAGLSGALMLVRSLRSVAVIDSGQPRNAPAEGVHGLLGREGIPPRELVATGRREVAGYGGATFIDGEVTGASRDGDDGLFELTLADGRSLRARRLLITTGLVDVLPEIDGLAERWGRDVIHCPYCHGWEVRDQPVGVISSGPMSIHHALLFHQLTEDVVFFANDMSLEDEASSQLDALGIPVVEGHVAALEVTGDVLTAVRLEDGRTIERAAVVVATRMEARAGFLADLGLEAEDRPGVGTAIAAASDGATAVPGVWVAGNVADPMAQVGIAAAAGGMAGARINADLVMEGAAAAQRAKTKAD